MTNKFLPPLWNLFLAIVVYYIFLEFLKKVGSVKSK